MLWCESPSALLVPFHFYRCLILLDRHPRLSEVQRQEYCARASECQRQLAWQAQQAPMRYQHKLDLVEAERRRVLGKAEEATACYDKAIDGARKQRLCMSRPLRTNWRPTALVSIRAPFARA
jgi:hypothetical protein